MGVIEEAVAWIRAAAADAGVGYDQQNRWGPDYDCSSLVITAWEQAGLSLRDRGATYTGNMRDAFLSGGFTDVTSQVDRSTGTGLTAGDVLLNYVNHAAMVIAPGRIAEAAGNEQGGITGGQTGDQTGREVRENGYYNYPWDCVLRYGEIQNSEFGIRNNTTAASASPSAVQTSDPQGESYTVKSGDTLWSIAEKYLGSGSRWGELAALNGLTGTLIRPGLTLRLRQEQTSAAVTLPELREGCTGEAVRALQTLLTLRGFPCEADGELGPLTMESLRGFAASAGMEAGDAVSGALWMGLIG